MYQGLSLTEFARKRFEKMRVDVLARYKEAVPKTPAITNIDKSRRPKKAQAGIRLLFPLFLGETNEDYVKQVRFALELDSYLALDRINLLDELGHYYPNQEVLVRAHLVNDLFKKEKRQHAKLYYAVDVILF